MHVAPVHNELCVDHLPWDLRAIFRLVVQDGLLATNPAEMLFTPRRVPPARRVLGPVQVQAIRDVLDLREQLIVRPSRSAGTNAVLLASSSRPL